MRDVSARTEVAVTRVVGWLGIARGKFFDWCQRYGKANEHNALVPRDHWIEEGERQAIVDYFDRHPLVGDRRLTFMMLDADVVAVSPATTYRVLARAGRLDRWARPPSKKGTGVVQPLAPHEHWHQDFKEFIRLSGMTHVRTSPYYPQSNGKTERWHQTLKGAALRPAQAATMEEAQRIVTRFVDHYNRVRPHSALGYVAPLTFMTGQAPAIWAARDRKLEAAREQRRQRREAERAA